VWFNLYSPHALTGATIGGAPLDLGTHQELGVNVYDAHVAVPPGGEVVLEVRMHGQVAAGPDYRVRWFQQPTIKTDHVTVDVHWRASGPNDPGVNGYPSDREATISSDARTDGDVFVTRPQ